MKGTPWAAWYPKFTNLFVIAIAYSCIAPLVLGFAVIGISLFYLSYRYNMMYMRQTKIDTRGENYQRTLKQMMTGIYLAQLCLIGLFSARSAGTQATVMTAQLVLTAVLNGLLDRTLRPLELYLGTDKWVRDEAPLLAREEGINEDDEAEMHIAQHTRRLGLTPIGKSNANKVSHFLDTIISASRERVAGWMHDPSARHFDDVDPPELSEEEIRKAYLSPALTSKTPKMWLPRDEFSVSKDILEANKEYGIEGTDEGASIDEKGRVSWEKDFEKVPIFSQPKII